MQIGIQRPAEVRASARRDHDFPDRYWLIPSLLLTSLLGFAALILMPLAGYHEIPPYFRRFVNWLAWSGMAALGLLFLYVLHMQFKGIDSPAAHLKQRFIAVRRSIFGSVAAVILAGVDMLFFMWIKPEVTAVSPFWADQLLADLDLAIFGTDPWRFFRGIDLTFHAWAYSFFWAIAIMGTIVWLAVQRPSLGRGASLLSYFALWSLFGPIGQYLFSAAGPIFYERVGLGDRFGELSLHIPAVTNSVAGYLWTFHSSGTLGVGAGISAMPSLHIATVAWIYLAFKAQRSWIAPLAAIFALYILLLSIALGWHYAVDGIVGVIGAIVSQAMCYRYLCFVSGRPARSNVSRLCRDNLV